MDEPEVQLAVKRNKIKTINGPGLVWLLIILSMLLMAIAVIIFNSNNANDGTSITTPTPTETPNGTTQPQRIYTISYKSGVFSPTNLRIHSGDTVRFKNEGFTSIRVVSDPHPEHNNLVGFDSVGEIPQNSYFSFTFAAKGTFGYHSEKNTNELGTIIVR
jgi:plastocyanin